MKRIQISTQLLMRSTRGSGERVKESKLEREWRYKVEYRIHKKKKQNLVEYKMWTDLWHCATTLYRTSRTISIYDDLGTPTVESLCVCVCSSGTIQFGTGTVEVEVGVGVKKAKTITANGFLTQRPEIQDIRQRDLILYLWKSEEKET